MVIWYKYIGRDTFVHNNKRLLPGGGGCMFMLTMFTTTYDDARVWPIPREGRMLPRGRKTYVLDTSVLMHDPECIESLKDNEIVIPGPVLQELGDLMHANDERKKFQAREATRAIEAYDASGSLASEQGVPTKVGGILRIEMRSVTHKKLPVGYIHT